MAKFRPLQALTGNYDIHLDNYLVDSAGRIWAIDFGMAHLKTPQMQVSMYAAIQKVPVNTNAGEVVGWARFFRDWYRFRRDRPDIADAVRHLDDLIHYGDMRDVVADVRKLRDEDIEKIVREAMPNHADAQDVVQALNGRKNQFKDVIDDRWNARDPRALKSPADGRPGDALPPTADPLPPPTADARAEPVTEEPLAVAA